MNAAQPGRMMLLLLIVPGAGFIFLFLAAAIAAAINAAGVAISDHDALVIDISPR